VLGTVSDIDQLSEAISHATAPAFMLGAVAGFLSILVARLQRVVDRAHALAGASEAPPTQLQRRAELLNQAIYLSVLSALSTAALLILAFVCALFGIGHRTGVALMFVVALALLMAALTQFTREVRIGLKSVHLE
jgi:Protein of unknown function (DUF2721)